MQGALYNSGLEGDGKMGAALATSKQPLPQLDWGRPVEVMKDFDTVLMFGKLSAASPEGLTIKRISGERCFPVLRDGGALLIRCYDIQMAPIILRARVARSSGVECTVEEVEWIPYETQRKDTRYPLCPPAMVSVLGSDAQGPLQACELLNISVSGACIVAGRGYAMGQALELQIRLEKTDKDVACPCKVTRVTPRSGGRFEYGLLFEHPNEELLHGLEQDFLEKFHVRHDWPGGFH